jgi:hypothetical protein
MKEMQEERKTKPRTGCQGKRRIQQERNGRKENWAKKKKKEKDLRVFLEIRKSQSQPGLLTSPLTQAHFS